MPNTPEYSIITPTAGKRPKALQHAIASVAAAITEASLVSGSVEMLVGYDGVPAAQIQNAPFVRTFSLPYEGHFGNSIRRALLKAARGRRVVFLDDDNALTPQAFRVYEQYRNADMLIARIDVSRAFTCKYLPRIESDKELIRPSNIDPLCLCLSYDLVQIRCDGWNVYEGYESDYKNILRYSRRARFMTLTEETVGIYDAGKGMDAGGLNYRQSRNNA